MREMKENLWDISKNSTVNNHFDKIRREMIPDSVLK
jgi:hypothetical protein